MGDLSTGVDVAVIGAGPGGYVAAIRAAQLGKSVMLIDRERKLGGVCLHEGCIPSKALITAAHFKRRLETEAKLMGIKAKVEGVEVKQLQKWKQDIVDALSGGIESLLKKWNIEVVQGTALFESGRKLCITFPEGHRIVEFKDCIIATGSTPNEKEGFPFDEETIVSSTGALLFKAIPKSLAVIGGGYIGCELGIMWAKLGTKVTIIEHSTHLMRFLPPDVTSILEHHMGELGMEILFECDATAMKKGKKGVELSLKEKGKTKTITTEKVLVAIGRYPNTKGLGLENTKVTVDEKGLIIVNEQMRTLDPHIFAIGDVVKGPALAHKASMEGKIAAEVIAGKTSAFDQVVPSVIFTDPEIATVGLTEDEAKEQGYEITIGKFPFSALGRAKTMNATTGFVKVIAEQTTGVILGVQMIGPQVSNLIAEATLAIEMGATVEDLMLTIHAHPTLPESLAEASEVVKGMAIHWYQPKV